MAVKDAQDTDVFLDIYDLTAFTTQVSPVKKRDFNDRSVMGDAAKKWHPSLRDSELSWEGWFDNDVAGEDVALSAAIDDGTVEMASVWLEGSARGNEGYASQYGFTDSYEVMSQVGNLVVAKATLKVTEWDRVTSLNGKTTATATGVGSSNNDLSSSAAGARWYYWVTAISATGGNTQWKIDFGHSSDDSAWADKDTVTLTNAGGPQAAVRTIAGTVDQYTRQELTLDASSGSITILSAYVRLA